MDQKQQALLARDMIQMIRKYKDDADVLGYLDSFASSLARGLENDAILNWSDIAGVCDQRYYSLNQNTPIELNESILVSCEKQIQRYLPEAQTTL